MTNVTSDQLRDISVSVVEGFLNNKIPLSRGLAKQASTAQLNAEQIKRAVEATNTICYLKVLGMSDDRTVEFPLCKFAEVMSLVTLPEKSAAELVPAQPDVLGSQSGNYVSSEPELFTSSTVVDDADVARKEQEKIAFFVKEAAANEQALENLKGQSSVVADQLTKLAKVVAADEKGLDKLASIVDGEDYAQLSVLVTGTVQPHRDFGGHALFREAELRDVNQLAGLFKQAKRIVAETAQRSALQKRAEVLTSELTKEAGLASGIGKIVGGTVKATVGAPFRMAGRSIHNAVGPATTKVKNTVGAAASKVTGKPFTPAKFTPAKGLGLGTALGFAGSVAVDAAMYNPGRDKGTGRSNDVWDALQRD